MCCFGIELGAEALSFGLAVVISGVKVGWN